MPTTVDVKRLNAMIVERPAGSTMAERVASLLRSRVCSTRAAAEIVAEVRGLGHEQLAIRVWRAFGSVDRRDDVTIAEIVNAVKLVEPGAIPA